jgi:DnaJ family protein C protein 19
LTLLVLIALAVTVWAWRSGQMRALRFGDVAAVVAALCGLRMLGHGETPLGVIVLAGAAGWAWLRSRPAAAAVSGVSADTEQASLAEARDLLDLPADADRTMIEGAHRRIIGRVHPDAGGSNELARRVNRARDILLAELNRRSPRAS